MYQFDNDPDKVKEFLQSVLDVLDKKRPKKNCLEIVSPPSAGKNFFFDSVVNFCISWGTVGNANRNNNFPLNNCADKRVLMFNEPTFEDSFLEDALKLFAGDPLAVRIKFQHDKVICRTPIIVLSNKNKFPKDNSFNDRMIRYRWRSAPLLKEYNKKPCPLMFPNLLIKYGLWYIFCVIYN